MLYDNFVLMLVAVTTLATGLIVKGWSSSRRSFKGAWRVLTECVGAFVMFFSINVVVGVAFILLVRMLTPRFVSIYILDDVGLVVLSAIQGIFFRFWWSD